MDGEKIVLETQKWYVDGDFWIADMSLLGKDTKVTQKDMDNIKVVPNPYIVYSNYNQSKNGLRFTHLPKQCTITIYTITGAIVDYIKHDSNFDGDHFWYLENKHGYPIAPGLYIYRVVEKETDLEVIGKFAVVR